MSNETKRYVVREGAGQWVAGKRVKPGDVLRLTANQASYELTRRQIELHPDEKAD